jgi:hypothetical protein
MTPLRQPTPEVRRLSVPLALIALSGLVSAPASASAPAGTAALPPPVSGTRGHGIGPPSSSPWGRIAGQLLAGAVVTGLAYSTEDPERAATRLEHVGDVSDLDFLGSGWTMAAGIGSLAAYGRLRGATGATELARDLALAWALAGGTTGVLKVTVNRTRPGGGDHSFPSGHTATAFCAAPVLSGRFGWRVGVPAYLVASAVALGRMEDRRHYLSDVVAGAAIGIAAGTWVASRRTRLRVEAGPGRVALGMDW